MKKIFSFIALLAGVISFTSCSSDDATYQATPKLEVTSADVLFEAAGGNGNVVVNASGAVTATTTANWLTLSVQGNNVVVSANPNITLEGRSGLIKIVSGDTEAEVTATQKGSVYGIPSLEYKMGDYQASLNIDVVHNLAVTVESQADWLAAVFNEETSQIELVAEDNDEADPRVGTVIVTMGDYSDEIVVTQAGLLLEVETDALNAANKGASATVSVEHTRTVEVASQCDWITATFDQKTSSVKLTVAENASTDPRIGHVTVTSGPAVRDIAVTQYDFESTVNAMYYLVYYSASSQGWEYFISQIDGDKLQFIYPASATVNLLYEIPVVQDVENESLAAGPCSSFMGKYGANYWIYLVFRSTQGYWSAYSNTTAMAEGGLSFEEEEGATTTYIEWGGKFGDYDIDAWAMRAMKAEGFSSANNAGYLDSFYYPYMERISDTEPSAAPAMNRAQNKTIMSRGHIVKPAAVSDGIKAE